MASVVIKVSYENSKGGESPEIRRFPGGAAPTYTQIHDKVKQAFPTLETGHFHIYWRDSDDDLVICSSDDELKEALTSVRDNVLKLYISDSEGNGEDMDNEMEDSTLVPGCVGWGKPWRKRRGMCEGRNMRRGWHWNFAGGMPMEGVPPRAYRRWMKRCMKNCHKKGKCGSGTEGEITPREDSGEKSQKEAMGGEDVMKEKNQNGNDMDVNVDDSGRKHRRCRKKCPGSAEDKGTSSGSSDDDTTPEAEFPGFPMIFPGQPMMFQGGPPMTFPGHMGMMGLPPPHAPGFGHHFCPRRGGHGFHGHRGGWHGAEHHESCNAEEMKKFNKCRSKCHSRGKCHYQGQSPRNRCRQQRRQNEAEKSTHLSGSGKDDVITMEEEP